MGQESEKRADDYGAARDRADDYGAAMDRALKYLGPKARSRQQVSDALQRSGYEGPAVSRVVKRLEELSILDDTAYASEVARQARARGKGVQAVKRELALQGLGVEVIDSALVEAFPAGEGHELVVQAASKKAAGLRGLPPETQHRRLAGFLTRRGHDPEMVSEVCRQILGDFAKSD